MDYMYGLTRVPCGLDLMSFDHVFFFNDTATTEIYTLSLHDALPISTATPASRGSTRWCCSSWRWWAGCTGSDRKSTRLNSSHANISYAVFCLKKKKHRRPHSFVVSTLLNRAYMTSSCYLWSITLHSA